MPLNDRVVIVEFEDKDGNIKTLQGIDVRFDVTQIRGSVQNRAKISICNLPKEDIHYLTTITAEALAIGLAKKLWLYVGYGDNVKMIFAGYILYASPTQPPDIWLEMICMSQYTMMIGNKEVSIPQAINFSDLMKNKQINNGLQLDYKLNRDIILNGFYFSGSYKNLISNLELLADCIIYIDEKNIMHVVNRYEYEPKEKKDVPIVSMKTGMVGIPRIDVIGAEFTTLINNQIELNEPIYLESYLMPQANGYYTVVVIKWVGSLRGNEFYMEIKTQKTQIQP